MLSAKHGGVMAFYSVKYYSGVKLKGSTPKTGNLETVKRFAANGLIRHGADRAEILNDDTGETDAEVTK
jgi:hypothetical protein